MVAKRSGGDAQLSCRLAEMGVRPPGAFVDDVDDPCRGLFQGEASGVDDGRAQPSLNGAYLVQFIEDLPQVCVAVVGAEPPPAPAHGAT